MAARRTFFTLDEYGNARRLAHYFGSKFRYVEAWGTFIAWDGHCWVQDPHGIRVQALAKRTVEQIKEEAKNCDNEDVKKALHAHAKASRTRSKTSAMVDLVKSEPGVCIDHTKLDADPWLLNTGNKTVNLKTNTYYDPKPSDLITKMTPVKFDPKAKAPKWESFLNVVLPDPDVRKFLQQFMGYCLTGLVTERVFVVLYGTGKNGKSVFLQVLHKMLKGYAVPAPPNLLMSRDNESHPVEVAALFGARVAIAPEVKKGSMFDEEKVKRLTGNDPITARRMHENFWEFEPTFKLLIAANHQPVVRDDSPSFWDRIALVPFTVRIDDKKEDRGLLEKLKKELPGILAWALRGCAAWRAHGSLVLPDVVKDATKQYQEVEDKIGKFLEDRCVFGVVDRETGRGRIVTNDALALAIRNWCERNNVQVFGERSLGARLIERGCVRAHNIGPRKQRGWQGVSVNSPGRVSGAEGDSGDTTRPISPVRPSRTTTTATTSSPLPQLLDRPSLSSKVSGAQVISISRSIKRAAVKHKKKTKKPEDGATT
jgi:putative DNA primase/helicase